MPSNSQLDGPLTLTGLFPDSDGESSHGLCYEEQSINIVGKVLRVRQSDFHSHNANQVWPGTFNLAEYLLRKDDSNKFKQQWGNVLELGTATGLLAIRLCQESSDHNNNTISSDRDQYCIQKIITSDVKDEGNEIASNLAYNYELNSINNPPPHIPHTWGTGWMKSVEEAGRRSLPFIDTIVASDILLYYSAYPALIKTLQELIPPGSPRKFVMSWNRRMKESADFFELAKASGFSCAHQGKCIYVFERNNDSIIIEDE